ncbi:undecaprenyl-phosphate glucose phosphotransferase [Novispirillum sp. DQ9]|uniref:undecaprenyl-phosphate glucose phosphotransferase n=1 Tax=Novispirillum sp. DQ9 TaxID=3398612 RepID=UPI003C7C53BB
MSDRTMLRQDILTSPLDRPGFTFSPKFAASLFVLGDMIALLLPGFLMLAFYVGLDHPMVPLYMGALLFSAGLSLAAFRMAGLYGFDAVMSPVKTSGTVLVTLTLVYGALLAMAFGIGLSEQMSRVWFFTAAVSSIGAVWSVRVIGALTLDHWARAGRMTRRIAILGAGEQGRRFLERLRERSHPWIQVVGVYDDRRERVGPEVSGFAVRGTVDDLIAAARRNRIDDIIVALPWAAEMRLVTMIERLKEVPVHVRLSADLIGYVIAPGVHHTFGDLPVIDAAAKPLDGWRMVVKVLEDKVLAAGLLLLFSPVLLAVALAIKLESRGPVFFRQERYGFNNQVFRCWKFRSMYHGRPPEKTVPQARRDDPRVTRVGRFIRRTSLDELPQLFNVLMGEMSLVGPRPHAVAHNEQYAKIIDGYFARHRVRPGITGWAQVNGLRGETDTPEKMRSRVQYDVYYIENWSLIFDLLILFRTAFVGFVHKNAY